jgi:Protein of unknown function (DUF3995)
MVSVIARVVAATVAALGFLHIYWAVGGRIGESAAIPQVNGASAFVPSRSATLLVAAALLFAATVVAIAGGLINVNGYGGIFRILAFGLSATFLARAVGDFRLVGFFKRIRGTQFARLDTIAYSPLCLVLGASVLYIAVHDV